MAIVSLVLSDPIAITCCINFSARKVTKFMAIVSLVLIYPIVILHVASTLVLEKSQNLWQMEDFSNGCMQDLQI